MKMEAVHSAVNLVTLNLQGNSISEIVGLEGLVNLQWVNLAGNTVTVRRFFFVWGGMCAHELNSILFELEHGWA